MKVSVRKLLIPVVSLTLLSAGTSSSASYNGFWSYFFTDRQSLPTITDIVSRSGGEFDQNGNDFDILLNSVTTAGLADALADRSSDLTVLAPTDKAFIRLAQDLGYPGDDETGAFEAIVAALTQLGNGDPIPVLTNVLLYHVVPERLRVRKFVYSDSIETLLDGATITPDWVRLVDNEPDIENARFVYPVNKKAANGFVHAVNRVLLPIDVPGNTTTPTSNVVDIVAASGGEFDRNRSDYDILLNAVAAADLAGALSDPAADFTVFAPNDQAFLRLAYDFGYRGHDEEDAFNAIVVALTDLGGGDPIPLLTDILLYHVSAGGKTLKEVTDTELVNTLLAGASLKSFGVFIIDNAPKLRAPNMIVRASNIRATNGIIHTISRVLIPLDIAPVWSKSH